LILLLATSILTNQEAVLFNFLSAFYACFMQQEGLYAGADGISRTHLPLAMAESGKSEKRYLNISA